MKILVASDSFKGTLSSRRIGEILRDELKSDHDVEILPVSDGGEGFIDAIRDHFSCLYRSVSILDPLGREFIADYLITREGKTAFIESAKACGLHLLKESVGNPLKTSTYGLGQMVKDAIEMGAQDIFVGLGGSSTNDGGTGMMEALGVEFLDEAGRNITCLSGEKLVLIKNIRIEKIKNYTDKIRVYALTDVNNPLLGSKGATHIYAPQKGADPGMVSILEDGMTSYSEIVQKTLGIDHSNTPGAGAAGGLGYCFKSFLNSRIVSGIDTILDLTGFDERLRGKDLVITGEGKIDEQSMSGKVPAGIIRKAKKSGIPVIGICGINELFKPEGFEKVFSIVPAHAGLGESMESPEYFLRKMLELDLVPWCRDRS